MKRIIGILLLVSALGLNVHAGEKGGKPLSRMTFGLEWGYVATIHAAHHYYFFAPEGYRVDDRGHAFGYLPNADAYFHFGYDLGKRWNISMYIGYEGIADLHKAVPVSLRMTRFFKAVRPEDEGSSYGDRWFSFLDLGSGICLKSPVQEIYTGKVGGGYRLSLSSHTSLDFIFSARFTHTHSEIIYDNQTIAFDRINRNNAYITAVSLGMALNF